MAKPIEGVPPFTGKAAAWLARYVKRANANPDRQRERKRRDEELARRIQPLERPDKHLPPT